MNTIYEPKGKAREYSSLACNLFTGCQFGCKYCYCPSIMKKSLDDWKTNPQPRKNILQELERKAKTMQGDKREILFCFMSDPNQSEDAVKITIGALTICEKYSLRAQILTKNPAAILENDEYLRIVKSNNYKIGVTLLFVDDDDCSTWEPFAPPPTERIRALKKLHSVGVKTWVSLEPVIIPSQALSVIDELHNYVDFWKVGKLNHLKESNSIDWTKFYYNVIQKFDNYNLAYYVKKDLLKFSKGGQ